MPRASAVAMLPAPISPSFIGAQLTREYRSAREGRPSGLVEEALLDQPRALLGRYLDVARGEQEHLVGNSLHPAVEGVGETGGEVDEALGEVRVRALEVEDHGNRVL